MTDKEQIIINGVDVSGCYFLNKGITNLLCTCPSEIDEECKYNPNCYFKQLQYKGQEYKELKAYAQRQENQREEYYKEYLKKDKALDEIEKEIHSFGSLITIQDIISKAKEGN